MLEYVGGAEYADMSTALDESLWRFACIGRECDSALQ